ncbi:MAG TPA: HlyD family secretion protein, partial [Sphingobacterium sp.]|nr:HlyD family secretion protein [Sphingobacterium sp.]
NFVKTVQRLPVKIKLTKDNKAENVALLRPGMNADVDVHVQ